MINVYIYNQPKEYVRVQLTSPGGVKCCVAGENSKPGTKVCTTRSITGSFGQMGRHDTLCKRGIAKWVQNMGEDGSNPYDPPVTYKAVNEVDTLEKAIDYVAREYGVIAKTKVKALNEAHKHGIDFPNLK